MKRALWWCLGVGIVSVLLTLILIGLRSGPVAPVPTTDPTITLNAEHADLVGNAAPYYKQAMAALNSQVPGVLKLSEVADDPEMRRIAADWVAANNDALAFAMQGAAEPDYWVDLPNDWTKLDLAARSGLRELAKLMAARATTAMADRDWGRAAETIVAIDALGRQLERTPTLIDQLISLAIRGLAQELILVPLGNGLQTGEDIAAYAAAIEPCFAPPAGLANALRTEADIAAWGFANGIGWASNFWMHLVAPPSRLNAEMQANLKPLLALLGQPVESWADPNDPLARAVLTRLMTTPPTLSVASGLAHQLIHSNLSAVQLAARLVAQQRGDWTVLQIHAFIASHGKPPTSLTELPPGERLIDPFSGQSFVYQPVDGGFKLYSLGADRDDDGGTHDARWGQPAGVIGGGQPTGGDYVFWPRQK